MEKIPFLTILCLFTITGNIRCDCPTIKTRSDWSARSAKATVYQTLPVKFVIVHHTVSQKCETFEDCSEKIRNIQDYQMFQLDYEDVAYNFIIGDDGNVYEGVGWHKVGAHTYGYNSRSIGIAFMGDFRNDLPASSALQSAKNLLECGTEQGELDRRYILMGARQVGSTESPGLKLFNEIKTWDHWLDRSETR